MGIIELIGVVIALVVAAFGAGGFWARSKVKKNEELKDLKRYKDATERMGKVSPPVDGSDAVERLRRRIGKS